MDDPVAVCEWLANEIQRDNYKAVREFTMTEENYDFKFEPGHSPLPPEICDKCPVLSAAIYYDAYRSFEHLCHGSRLEGADSWGRRAVHFAAMLGRMRMLSSDLLSTVDFSAVEWRERTPLFMAAQNGHLEAVKFLVEEKHCDVNARDSFGMTCLHVAFENGRVDVITYLMNNGAEVVTDIHGRNPIVMAVKKGRVEALRSMSATNMPAFISAVTSLSLLRVAASAGQAGVCRFLCKLDGVDVNAVDANGRTALHYAAEADDEQTIVTLLTAGCSHVSADCNGMTPLHIAAIHGGHITVAPLISGKGEENEVHDKQQRTPLMLASMSGNAYAVQDIMNARVDVTARDTDGRSAIDMAAGSYTQAIKKILSGEQGSLGHLEKPRSNHSSGSHSASSVTPPASSTSSSFGSGCEVC